MDYGGIGVVTRQGQVTLPKKAREALNVALGSALEFFYNKDFVIIKKREKPEEVLNRISESTARRFAEKGITEKDVSEEIGKYRVEKRK